MAIETVNVGDDNILPGMFLWSGLPPAAANKDKIAYVTDMEGGCYAYSDGAVWRVMTNKRAETFNGVTDASGNYSVVFAIPFLAVPHVDPVCYPAADSTTRVRVTAVSANGFTVKTEKNNTLSVLGLDVLGLGTANVASVPVRVLVLES